MMPIPVKRDSAVLNTSRWGRAMMIIVGELEGTTRTTTWGSEEDTTHGIPQERRVPAIWRFRSE